MNKPTSLVLSLSAAAVVAILPACKPSQPAGEETTSSKPSTPAASPVASAAAASTPEATPAATTSGIALKDPVAVVNGENISRAQLEEAFNSAVQSAGAKVDALTDEQKLEGYSQLLDDLIMEKLVTKAAEGVVVPQADIDAEIAKIKGQFPTEEDFNKQMAAVGQPPEKLGETIGKMLKQQKWMESQLGDKTKVTDADAKKFYDENKKEFEEPETVKASHILFLVKKDDSEDVVKKQLDAAKKAAARAKKGEDFNKLAKELSEDPSAKENGGDLGYFPKENMVPEFANAAFSQKVGVVGEPVRTEYGWHLIKVADKKPAGTAAFDDVKKQLTAYLEKDKQRKAVQELLKSMKDSAKIETTLPAPAPAPVPAMAPQDDKPGN